LAIPSVASFWSCPSEAGAETYVYLDIGGAKAVARQLLLRSRQGTLSA